MNTAFVGSIASYAKRYQDRFLGKYNPALLLNDWWAALDFFFSRACFQGRRDQVSEQVYQAVVATLSPHFGKDKRASNYKILSQQRWKPIETALWTRVGKGKIGKARDINMVLSALDFIDRLPNLNIVKYSVDRIRLGRINDHYLELQASQSMGGITQVGPKIAAFYLRDVVSLYALESLVPSDFAFCLQPVDVWVRKLAYTLGIAPDGASDQDIQNSIVALCLKHQVSPLQFNQGAWYVGSQAFEIALELMSA